MDLDTDEEGLSLGLVTERPAWAGDLRAMGGLREDGEEIRYSIIHFIFFIYFY